MAKKVFKRHPFGQIMLLPPSLDEMIEQNHPVRIVNEWAAKSRNKNRLAGYRP